MAMLLGKKVGMTQVYDESGSLVPVTVIQAGPCQVLQVKTTETDGYNAVQLGFDEVKPSRRKHPQIGFEQIKLHKLIAFLPLDEAVAFIAVFVIVSGSDGRAETLLDPTK